MSRYLISAKPNKAIMKPSDRRMGPVKLWPASKEDMTLGVIFGFDHALGIFFDIFTPAAKEGDEEVVHVEASGMFDGISRSHLLEVVEYYASEEEKEELKTVIGLLVMDLPF